MAGTDSTATARFNRQLIYAGRGVRSFTTAFLSVVFPLYLATEGYSSTRIGLVITVGGFISAAVVLAVGFGGDRYGRRTMLLAVSALGVLGGAVLLISANLALMMVANGLCGIGRGGGAGSGGSYGAIFPAEQPLLAASTDARRRTAAFGRLGFIGVSAGALGSLVAWVPEVLHSSGWSWSASYRAVFAIGAVLSIVMVATVLPIRERRSSAPAVVPEDVEQPRAKMSTGQLLKRLAIVNALNGFGFGFLGPLLVYWFHVRYGVGPGTIGVLYTVINVATMLPYLGSGALVRRFGAVRTVVWTRAIGFAFMLTMIWMPTFMLAGLAYGLRLVANSFGMPARQSYVMGVADEHRRSTIAAAGMLPAQLSSSVSPVVGGALMASFIDVPILGAVLFMSANTVGFYLAFHRYRPPGESSHGGGD